MSFESLPMPSSARTLVMSRASLARIFAGAALAFGLASIFASTAHLSRFEHWAVVFPWQFPLTATVPFFLTGIFVFLAVACRPAYFWPASIFVSVSMSGVFVLRFSIFDEWLMAWIALAGLVAIARGEVSRRRELRHPAWTAAFLLLALHLCALSVAGFALYGNPKAVRFLLIFLSVFLTAGLVAFYQFPEPRPGEVTRWVAIAGLVFCGLYLVHGWIFWSTVKTTILEGVGFATSGYQTAPFVAAVPAAILLVGRNRRPIFGASLLAFVLLITALSDSRGGMLAVLVGLCFAPFAIGLRRWVKILGLMLCLALLAGILSFGRAQWILDSLGSTMGAFNIEGGTQTLDYFGKKVTVARGDGGRFLYLKTGMVFLVDRFPFPALTGAGIYGYFPAANDIRQKLADQTNISLTTVNYASGTSDEEKYPARPPAAGAMMVESGWIGMALLGFCVCMAFSAILLRTGENGHKYLIFGPNMLVAACLVTILGFTYFSELQDMSLVYLLIMPQGLAHLWGRIEA